MADGVRWGILATGWIAERFTADAVDAGIDVVAVGSGSADRARAFADRFGIPRAHGSYEALAADPDVDVIYVATPHPFHAENALTCLRAGKHVLVEKPFAMTQAEAAEIADYAVDHGLLVQEAMWTRFLPHMIRIRELVSSGALGELRTLTADHSQRLPSDPEHRILNPDLGGGALLDLGIYPVSFAWDILGAPTTVRALSVDAVTGVDRQTSVLLGYANGAQALLQSGLDARGTNRAAIVGTEARIEIEPVWFAPASFLVIDAEDRVIERYESVIEGTGLRYEAFAVEAALAAGRFTTAELPVEESIRIVGTLDEVRTQIGLRYPGEA